MTIEVLTRHRDGGTRTASTFADIVEAARYALRVANEYGLTPTSSAPTDPPIEVWVMDDGKIILALKVQRGGLVPSTGPRQSTR
jgi:hypothetical protein